MKSPAEKVNPYIGTIGHLLQATRPLVMLPHGPARICPDLTPRNRDYYFGDHIAGFPIGPVQVMPGMKRDDAFNAPFDHSLEESHPYFYGVDLEDSGIRCEATTTRLGYVYRFTGAKAILLRLGDDMQSDYANGVVTISHNPCPGQEFPMPPSYIRVSADGAFTCEPADGGLLLIPAGEAITLFGSVSHISLEKAEEIFQRELSGKTFDTVCKTSRETWDKLLGRVRVDGNTDDMQTVFYTGLYRTFMRMVDYAEYGQYRGIDGKIYEGDYFYCDDGIWDTFRCMHPLQLLLEPRRQEKIMDSYLQMYKQSGSLPCFPRLTGDSPVMLGFHTIASLADAAAKGLNLDYNLALEAALESGDEQTMLPWVCNRKSTELDQCYYEHGFFPALKKDEPETFPGVHEFEARQAVAVSLEHAYDDWCLAQLARRQGRMDVYDRYMKRAENYKVLYNHDIGFMAPKSIDGNWVEDFDPMWGGGQGGRDYFAECNSYTYTWSVFHDVEGLGALMGGREAMAKRLDELFTTDCEGKYKFYFLAQFPDETGLMGQFPMGNEPAFHIPYLYNYCGQPWKAQRRLREIMDLWFTNSPYGICGDEDGGAMSSWIACSGMGFYPVCPGSDQYVLGTPLFDHIEIDLENGNTFTIEAAGAGDGARYIQSATLNGVTLDRPWLTHDEITSGGTLALTMGRQANKEWCADAQPPYSMSLR